MDSIIFKTQAEADVVLDTLVQLVKDGGAARVNDLNVLCSIPVRYGDAQIGWDIRLLEKAVIHKHPEGFALSLPDPLPIVPVIR